MLPMIFFAHEGHPLQLIGSFHLIFLHFPIALINMVAVSEILFAWKKQMLFEFSSRFMLLSAAVLAPPTALFGWILSYSGSYTGLIHTFFMWHLGLGFFTAFFTVILALIREKKGRSLLYFVCLVFLLILINLTGFFGGEISFDPLKLAHS